MKLLAYKIGTEIVGIDLLSWDEDQLGGNQAFKVIQDADTVPIEYEDISSIENWKIYGPDKIGTITNFKDWMCLRDIIKGLIEAIAGANYSTYAALTAAQKAVAILYVPTKVIDNVGLVQFVTDSGGAANANANIKNYLKKSAQSNIARYEELVSYAYSRLGKTSGLKIEDTIRANELDSKFKERRTFKKSDDSVDGIEDYLRGTDSFVLNGLLIKLTDLTFALINDGSGQTNEQFIDKCVEIIKEGKY